MHKTSELRTKDSVQQKHAAIQAEIEAKSRSELVPASAAGTAWQHKQKARLRKNADGLYLS